MKGADFNMDNNKTIIELEAQISALKKQLKNVAEESKKKEEKLNSQIKTLKAENNNLMELLKLSKKKMFGSSAEKVAQAYGQISFFNEAEQERTLLTPEPKIEEIVIPKHTRKKKRSYAEIYKDLPVEEIIYDIPEEKKNCDKCGEQLSFLKYEIRREITLVPAKVTVVEHKKAVYVCKNCDKTGIESNFVTADTPKPLIEKSLVSASMLSEIINQKYCLGVPLYRLESHFKNMQINLTRQTMANWIISASNLVKPLLDEMHKELLVSEILHADETTLEVLEEPGRNPQAKSYMWVYTTGKAEEKDIILYDYRQGRSGAYAKEFLNGFKGYIHCDGWSGYDKLEAKRVGCLAHVRRYFKEAIDVQADKNDYSTVAGQGFLLIEKIFSTEHKITDEKEIREIRKKTGKEAVEEFFDFCETANALPKSLTGKAVSYAINQKENLMRYLENEKLEMTNNRAERAVKPFVIGRKNWLFCNTPGGATASARLYSVIETARANNLKIYDYLVWMFENIHILTTKELLPWSSKIPENIRKS